MDLFLTRCLASSLATVSMDASYLSLRLNRLWSYSAMSPWSAVMNRAYLALNCPSKMPAYFRIIT